MSGTLRASQFDIPNIFHKRNWMTSYTPTKRTDGRSKSAATLDAAAKGGSEQMWSCGSEFFLKVHDEEEIVRMQLDVYLK